MLIENLKRLGRYVSDRCVYCDSPIPKGKDVACYCSVNCLDQDGKWCWNIEDGTFVKPRLFKFE